MKTNFNTLEEYKDWLKEQKNLWKHGGNETSTIEQQLMEDVHLEPLEILEAKEIFKIQRTLLEAGYYADNVRRNFISNGIVINASKMNPEKIKELLDRFVWTKALLDEVYPDKPSP
jgi:hypothetical protein